MRIANWFLILGLCGGASPALADADSAPTQSAASDQDAICTDRPTKSTGACITAAGRWQVEADIANFTRFKADGVTTDTWILANPTLKLGLSPSLDLEANFSPYVSVRTKAPGGEQTRSGVSDLFLKLKDKVYSQGPLDIAVLPWLKAPTARSGIGNRAWEGGVVVPVVYKLNDDWSLNLAPEFDALKNSASGGRHLWASSGASLTRNLPNNLALSGEIWVGYDFDPVRTTTQTSADVGLAWAATKDLQFDGGVNIGLNRQTPDVQLYIGVSRRF